MEEPGAGGVLKWLTPGHFWCLLYAVMLKKGFWQARVVLASSLYSSLMHNPQHPVSQEVGLRGKEGSSKGITLIVCIAH